MKSSPIIAILLIFLLGSCKNPDVREIGENYLDQSVPLVGEPTSLITPRDPARIGILEDHLLVLNRYSSPYFQIYEINTFKLVGEFGFKSDRDSVGNPFYFHHSWKVGDDIHFEVIDFKTNRALIYSLQRALAGEHPLVRTKNIPLTLIKQYVTLISVSDQTYWGSYAGSDSRKGSSFTYNMTDKEQTWEPFTPQLNNINIVPSDLHFVYYSFSSFNHKRKIIGSAQKFFKRVDFFDQNGVLLNKTQFVSADLINYVSPIVQDPNVQNYYNASFPGDDFFYALCINAPQQNYPDNKGAMELHIFNWDGSLFKAVKLDRMFLGSFVVDEKNKRLFTISYIPNDKNNALIQYDLSTVL